MVGGGRNTHAYMERERERERERSLEIIETNESCRQLREYSEEIAGKDKSRRERVDNSNQADVG